jgi:hypothetical protein
MFKLMVHLDQLKPQRMGRRNPGARRLAAKFGVVSTTLRSPVAPPAGRYSRWADLGSADGIQYERLTSLNQFLFMGNQLFSME